MEHLKSETLARLVDESPTPAERKHLDACARCAEELEAIREQTRALGALPELVPPRGDWRELEAHLRSEGLIDDPGLARRLGFVRTPEWMKAAAAVLLFLGGAGTGSAMTARTASGTPAAAAAASDVESAASAVRMAEQEYVDAVTRYRQLLAAEGGEQPTADPVSRFAALEHLVMVSQAAVRQAPGDPFLNGFLASALAERDAAARMVSNPQDNWF